MDWTVKLPDLAEAVVGDGEKDSAIRPPRLLDEAFKEPAGDGEFAIVAAFQSTNKNRLVKGIEIIHAEIEGLLRSSPGVQKGPKERAVAGILIPKRLQNMDEAIVLGL